MFHAFFFFALRNLAALAMVVVTVSSIFADSADRQAVSLVNPAAETLPHLGPMEDLLELASEVQSTQFSGETIRPHLVQGSDMRSDSSYHWQLMPAGLIYRPLLASAKESRFRSVWNNESGEGNIWDITLGGQVGLLRYGTIEHGIPVGWQLGIEGAGQVRLDQDENGDVMANDFRFGIPLTWGDRFSQVKLAFYHLSSHLGDEFLLKNPGFTRLNFSRDVLVCGYSIHPADLWRLYVEAGYAVAADVADEWEFQFGAEFSPRGSTGFRGEPFAAANAHLREEVDYGGNFVFQTGWAWRRAPTSGMLRVGVEYYNGKSDQFSFFDESEQKFGFGIWYDH